MTYDSSYGQQGVSELELDESEAYLPTPHDELVEAILNGEAARAHALVEAGADINALEPDEYPPLCMAVDQMEVEEVRRLLAFGANPNIADPQEKRTPLKMARRLHKEMGFGPAGKKDPLLDAMMALARQESGKQTEELKSRLAEIIRLLEAAGGR
jgi:Ankyrin repeats (many copies)